MYKRKTRDVYKIFQNFGYGYEEVDSFDTCGEAKRMAKEYKLAHSVPTFVKRSSIKIDKRYKV